MWEPQVNWLSPKKCSCNSKFIIFHMHINERYLEHFLWNHPHVNATRPHWWLVKIGSGNDYVPSGNKPLPEPMLTQIYFAIWCQSKLVQVMTKCLQATSHCLSQCWPRCMPPYGVTRPQWVNMPFHPNSNSIISLHFLAQDTTAQISCHM